MSALLAESIAHGIVSKGLRPGDRLATEADMLAEFGIGRATLREALRILETQGLIEVKVGAGGGPLVTRPDSQQLARLLSLLLRMSDVSVREVFDARLIIEPALAGQAAVNRQEHHLELLRENQRGLSSVERGSEEFRRYNAEFHTLLADASRNRPLAALWSALSAVADGHQAGVRWTPAVLLGTVAAHAKLVRAVEEQNPVMAAQAMTDHLTAAEDYVQRYYSHLFDAPIGIISSFD